MSLSYRLAKLSAMNDLDLRLARIASNQLGLVTRRNLFAAGGKRSAWNRRLASGHYELLHQGVARLVSTPRSRRQDILAAVLAAGPGSLASHRSAAEIWGLEVPEHGVDVITVARSRSPELMGISIHRPVDRLDLRPVVRKGIPVANPLRVLLDLGAVDPELVQPALDLFLHRGYVTPRIVAATRRRHARRGRAGLSCVDVALANLALGNKPPDSMIESVVGRLLRDEGIPAVFHLLIRAGELGVIEPDFSLPDSGLVLEIDGWDAHGHRQAFERDRERDAVLGAHGIDVVRWTWRQVTSSPDRLLHRLRAVLGHRLRDPNRARIVPISGTDRAEIVVSPNPARVVALTAIDRAENEPAPGARAARMEGGRVA